MSYEEVILCFKKYLLISGIKEAVIQQLSEVSEHEWHDLRKNLNDIPATKAPILCKYANGVYGVGFKYKSGIAITHGGSIYSPIIAWRYIEPFEAQSGTLFEEE